MSESMILQTNQELISIQIDKILEQLSDHYTLRKVNPEKYASIGMNGIHLTVNQYEIDTVGNLLLMDSRESDTLQMLTVVITPFMKALPLVSIDLMLTKEKRGLILELYDLVKEKDSQYVSYLSHFKRIIDHYDILPDLPTKSAWYDSLKTVHTAKSADDTNDQSLSCLIQDTLTWWIQMELDRTTLPKEDKQFQWNLIKEYADGLVEKGGVSTDLFKAILGAEQTKDFFNTVFFGTSKFA